MTVHSPLSDRVKRCEDDLSRLVHECLAHGELTEGETRELRRVTNELLMLNRDISKQKAELARLSQAIRRLVPGPTLH